MTKLFSPSSVADLQDYSKNHFLSDIQALYPKAKEYRKFFDPPKAIETWISRLPKLSQESARAFDALALAGQIPYFDDFDIASYGFDFAKHGALSEYLAEDYIGLSNECSGEMYVLEIPTGKVVYYSHEEDTIWEEYYFDNIDIYAWWMLRVASITKGVLALSDLTPYLDLLKQPAGKSEYSRLED